MQVLVSALADFLLAVSLRILNEMRFCGTTDLGRSPASSSVATLDRLSSVEPRVQPELVVIDCWRVGESMLYQSREHK